MKEEPEDETPTTAPCWVCDGFGRVPVVLGNEVHHEVAYEICAQCEGTGEDEVF